MPRFRPNAKGGRFTNQGRVSAKNRFSRSRMLFLKKLQNEKRAKERRKKRGGGKKSDRDDETTEKKSRFDVENLEKVELTDDDLRMIMKILDEEDVKSEMMKSTDTDSKKKTDESLPTSISNVTVAESNYDFRHESIVQRLEQFGFKASIVRDAVTRVTKEMPSDASAQQIERRAFVSHLLAQPPTDMRFEDVDALDEEERKDAREDEIMVLESILGEDKIVRDETQDRWCVAVDDVEIPEYLMKHCQKMKEEEDVEEKKDTTMTLEIWFPHGTEYPCTPPRFYVRDNRLPADLCLDISRDALTCSLSCVGSPCVYTVVTWLQENILSVVKNWIENRKQMEKNDIVSMEEVPDVKQEIVAEEKDNGEEEEEDEDVVLSKTTKSLKRRRWADGLYFESHPEMLRRSEEEEEEEEEDKEEENLDTVMTKSLPKPLTPSPFLLDIVETIEETERLQPWLFKDKTTSQNNNSNNDSNKNTTEHLDEMKNQQNKMNRRLVKEHHQRVRSEKYKKMLSQRERLPAYKLRDKITKTIHEHQVTVISGATGSGKTTQVPQLVLDHAIERGEGAECNIICTQPRRISAVGVADRVADERAERVGNTVGYQIRLESKRSRNTRLLFCTAGVLLRRLQCDSEVRGISHIFIDEVHERSLQSDFLLIILKGILRRRPSLKLVLMSATLNAELFADYFQGCPTLDIPGRAFPVTPYFLEDVFEMTGHLVRPGDEYAKREDNKKRDRHQGGKGGRGKGGRRAAQMRAVERATEESRRNKFGGGDDSDSMVDLRRRYPAQKYSESTLQSLMCVDESKINYDLIQDLLRNLSVTLPSEGSILIFLPGLMEITRLYNELNADKRGFGDDSKFVLHPLHSTLTTAEQKKIFVRPKKGVRKIVIATNIAETSITIDDCVCVIDTGRVKENRYDHARKMATLLQTWVSIASAKQRRGRAGRVRSGVCYHLFSSQTRDDEMDEYTLPEMLRVPLDETVLQIKMLDLGAVREFLGSAVNPPEAAAINDSLSSLRSMNALCNEDNRLTPLGFHLATLPVSPRIGKMIVYGAIFGCLDPILTIAASLSFRSPFVSPLDKRDEADRMKRTFCRNTCSDHLTLLRAFDGWRNAKSRGEEWSYCRRYFLSNTTLRMIDEMRKQFFELLIGIGFVSEMKSNNNNNSRHHRRGNTHWQKHLLNGSHNVNASNLSLIRSVICAGLYPNILRVMPTKREGEEPKIKAKDGEVFVHPVSVNFQEKRFNSRKLLVYMEKVKSSKVYIRDCSVISPYSVLLFGGSVKYYSSDKVVCVDGWLPFLADRRVAAVMKVLRNELNELLERKIQRPNEDLTEASRRVMNAVSRLLWSEQRRVFKKMDIAFDDTSSAKRENFNHITSEFKNKDTATTTTTTLSSTAASFVPSSVRMKSHNNNTTSFVPSSVRMKSDNNNTTSFVPSSVRMNTSTSEEKKKNNSNNKRRNRKKKDVKKKDEKKNHDENLKNEIKKKDREPKKKNKKKKKDPTKKRDNKNKKNKKPGRAAETNEKKK